MEIRCEMFPKYFLEQILNRPLFNVLPHGCADVCLLLIGASRFEVLIVTSTSKNQTFLPIIPLRQRFSRLDAVLHEATSHAGIENMSTARMGAGGLLKKDQGYEHKDRNQHCQ
jgi:hypothetical protein